MFFGLCAGLVIIQNDHGSVFGVFFGPLPALHRGLHETHHFVFEGRISKVFFQHVKAVFECGDALIFILEGHQFIRRHARVDDLPVFVIRHGGNAVRLTLKQRIDVEALLQNLDTVFVFAIGFDAKLCHPAKEREFVAKKPDAQRAVHQRLRPFDTHIAPAGQHHARGFERLCDVHQRQALFTGGQCRRHPFDGYIGTTTGDDLGGCDIRATGQDSDVQALFFVKALFKRHVVARELGLRDPFQLKRDVFEMTCSHSGACQPQCSRCRVDVIFHVDLLVGYAF